MDGSGWSDNWCNDTILSDNVVYIWDCSEKLQIDVDYV